MLRAILASRGPLPVYVLGLLGQWREEETNAFVIGLGSLFRVRVCGKEPEVVGQVELQELDVLLILTDRLKLSLEVIDSFNLHDFLSDLGRHRERFEQREQKLSLFVAIVLGSLLSVSLHK